ncbi:AAA family ATPase [Brachybacterium alimentarium]|uniref:AAA family ATPase n=1 Tax=Brachybacterium alimentarium TaxID=47845 RepID=UPI003FD394A4
MTLTLMCGLSFSGKSTLAARLAEGLPASVISLDLINEVNRPGFVRGSQVPRRRVPVRGGCDGRCPRARRAGSFRSRRADAGG